MPHPLSQRIGQLTRDARRVAVWQGVGWVAAASLGAALVLMLSDYVMRLTDPGMRWLSWALLITAFVAAAIRWLGGAEWTKINPLSTAQRIQSLRPGLGSRLASSVEFLNQEVEDPTAGSADLRRRVVAQTTAEIEQMKLEDVVDRRPLRRAIQALAAAVAVIVVFGLADPAGLRTAAARLAAPWSDQNWPRQNHLAVIDPPDRIARGQSFEVELIDELAAELPSDLRVQYRTRVGGRTRTEEQMVPASTDSVMLSRENIQQSFAFRVLGGDDQTMPWHGVDVVDAPQLRSITVTANPQPYTGIAPRELREDDRVLAGAEITIDAVAGAELATATLEVTIGDQKQEVTSEVSSADFSSNDGVKLQHTWKAEHEADEPVTASYRLRLTDREGLVGYSKSRTLRIEPDTVPSLEWLEPTGELLVTSQAVTPLRVLMEDNLAIAKAELLWYRPRDPATDEAAEEEPTAPKPERASIYQGPAEPPQRSLPPGPAPLDSREQSYEFDLSTLELKPGDQLVLLVEAEDFRPGIGQTRTPRRITILSDAEFEAQIAEKQSDLVQHLKRLLGDQRRTRDSSRELQEERAAGNVAPRDSVDRLSALGYQQLRINEGVSEPTRGAARQAERLLEELENNRLNRPDLSEQLESVRDALRSLADDQLAGAGRELSAAQRSAQQSLESKSQEAEQETSAALSQAIGQQDQAVEKLEDIVDELSSWSDYQRFAQDLSELEKKQRELRDETLKEAVRAAAEGKPSPERTAARAKLRAAQGELSRRFGKLLDSMRKSAATSGEREASESAQALKDAIAEAEDRATRGKLNEAERQLRIGQLGRSAQEQEQSADDIREMLDTLRDRASSDPGKLAEQLGKAQQKLEELQKELSELQRQADQNNQQQQREQTAERAQRLGRRLDRLDAPQASESTQQGGQRMQQSAEQPEQARERLDQAEEELRRAQQQLAERIRQLKNLQALRVLDRLAAKMEGFVARQTELLQQTVRTDNEVLSGAPPEQVEPTVQQLATDQADLRVEVDVARRNVAEREVFDLALKGALEQMDLAHERLDGQDTGRQTQQREYSAIERLKHVADALKINPPDDEQQQQPPAGGGQGGQQQQKPPSPIDVAELKMLRLMQLDVNAQTRELEADAADRRLTPRESREGAQRLSREQERLTELVEELIERLNNPNPPGEIPDDAA